MSPPHPRPLLTALAVKVAMAVGKRVSSLPHWASRTNHFQALCVVLHKAC
jgi:hypothetical protein